MLPKQVVKLRHSIIARIHNLNLLQSISQYIRQLQLFTFYFHILQIKFYTLFFFNLLSTTSKKICRTWK